MVKHIDKAFLGRIKTVTVRSFVGLVLDINVTVRSTESDFYDPRWTLGILVLHPQIWHKNGWYNLSWEKTWLRLSISFTCPRFHEDCSIEIKNIICKCYVEKKGGAPRKKY